jgi:hypothetical protein
MRPAVGLKQSSGPPTSPDWYGGAGQLYDELFAFFQ